MAPSLADEVAAAFDVLAEQRKADSANLAAWRAHSVDVGNLATPPTLSTSPTAAPNNPDLEARLRAKEAELAKLHAHAMDLQQRNEKLEADAEERASNQEDGVELPGMPGSSALPGNGGENAEANYAKFHELENLVAEQMNVIQQLTSEKKDLTVEMTAALKLIRQRDRENATLANQWRRTAPRAEDEGCEKDPFGFLSGLPVPLGAVFNPALPLTPDSMWDESSRVAYPSLFPPPQPPHASPLTTVQATSPSLTSRASRQRQGGLKKRGLRGCSRERLSEEHLPGQSTCTGRRVRWHPTVRFRVIPGPDDMYAGEQAAVWWSAQELRGFAKEEILRRRYATLQHLNRLDSEEDDSSSSSTNRNISSCSGEGIARASPAVPLPPSSATLRVARAASEEGTSSSTSSGALARRSSTLAAVPVAPAVASAAAIEVVRPYADYGLSGQSHSQQQPPTTPPLASVSIPANRGRAGTSGAAGATTACANATMVAEADLPPLAHTSAPVSIVVVPPSLSRASSAPNQPSPAAVDAAAAAASTAAGPSPSPHRPFTPFTSAPVFCPLASAVSPADFMADLAGPLALLAQERGLDPERVLDPMRHHSFLEGSNSAGAAAAGRAATAVAALAVADNTPSSSFDSGSSEEAPYLPMASADAHRHVSVVVEGARSGVGDAVDGNGAATPPPTTEASLQFYSPRPRVNSASDGSEMSAQPAEHGWSSTESSTAAAAATAPGDATNSIGASSSPTSHLVHEPQPQQPARAGEGGESTRENVGEDGSRPLRSSRTSSPPGDSSASDDSSSAETASSENSSEGSSGEEEEEAKGEPVTPPLPDVYVQKARRGTAVPSSSQDARTECNHSSDSSSLSGSSQSGSDEDDDAAAAAAAKRATTSTSAPPSTGNSRATSNITLVT